jgi:tetratricopeptide (TPR) repeat protein
VLSLSCLGLALLSKEQAVVIPLLFAWADALGLSADAPGRDARGWARRYAPVVALVAAYLALRALVLEGAALEIRLAVLRDPTGPPLSLLHALQTAVAPFGQLVYEPRGEVWLRPARIAFSLLVVAGLAVAARGAPRPLLFFAGMALLSVLPTANVFVQEARFAERYDFLALVAFAGVVALAAEACWHRPPLRTGALVATALLVLASGVTTVLRGRFYRDDESFHSQWLRSDPRAAQAHVGLAELRARQGRLREAVGHYREALAVNPDYATAHASLAVVVARQGDLEAALRHLDRALALEPRDAESHSNRGAVLTRLGRDQEAARAYQAALAIEPDFAEAHNNLGALLAAGGDAAAAEDRYRRALAADPRLARAHRNLGALLAERGEAAEAVRHLRAALELDPDLPGAAGDLAWILATSPDPGLRDGPEAVRWAERAARTAGRESPPLLESLAAALAATGRFEQAARWQARALALRPDDAGMRSRLESYRSGTALRDAAARRSLP